MFAEQLRRAVEASPRVELAKLGEQIWKAWSQGLVGDDDAQRLAEMIEARRALPVIQKPVQRRFGSRPKSYGFRLIDSAVFWGRGGLTRRIPGCRGGV
jgi:hypothetical protein